MYPRIKKTRIQKNMTQKQMAEKLNTKQPVYQRFENDTHKISFETAIKIADILGVSLDYLAGRSDEP